MKHGSWKWWLCLAAGLGLSGACAPVQDRLLTTGLAIERNRSDLDIAYVEAGAHRLAYLERPGARETIVLLHGFAARKDVWLRFVRQLPDHYHIIAVDLPGHGESSVLTGPTYDVDYITAVVALALAEVAPERFHLVGASLGGLVAILYALEYGERVQTLGLFASAGVYPPNPSEFQLLLEEGENPLLVDSRGDFDRLVDFVFYDPPAMPWPARPVITRDLVERAEVNRRIWDDIWAAQADITGELPGLDMPVLLLWGERDRVLDVSSIEVFEAGIGNVSTVVLPDVGHAVVSEQPQQAAQEYLDFLERAAL